MIETGTSRSEEDLNKFVARGVGFTIYEFDEKLALLMRDDDKRADMGRASRAVLQEFTEEAVGRQWVDLIEELCRDKEN